MEWLGQNVYIQNFDSNNLKEAVFKGALGVGNQLAKFGMESYDNFTGKSTFDIPQNSIVDPIDALSFAVAKSTYKGGGGTNLTMYYATPYIEAFYTLLVDENITDYGRPLYQRRLLSSLSGFCLCDSAELAISGLKTEELEIIAYLNSGVFIE